MSAVNPIFFPTQVILVDDDGLILKKLSDQIALLNRPVRTFSSPFAALDYIESLGQKSLSHKFMIQDEETLLKANLIGLYKEIFNPGRYSTISTIIADFEMPDMNGLDFLMKVKTPNIQKILLTGVADENLAINAFNDGIIDHYIKKHDPKIYPLIEACLSRSQNNFFTRETRVFLQAIHHDEHPQAIMEPGFEEFFKKILKEKDICEYYLLDSIGSFLLFDNKKNPSILFLFDEDILQYQLHAVSGDIDESDLSESEFEDIENHKKALCFNYFDDGEFLEAKTLSKYLQPLEKIQLGGRPYYYAYAPKVPNLKWPSKS